MSKEKSVGTITVKLDKTKRVHRFSRALFGKAGAGRKTEYRDVKKDTNRRMCRDDGEEE